MSDFSSEMKKFRQVRKQRQEGTLKSSYTDEAVEAAKRRQMVDRLNNNRTQAHNAALTRYRFAKQKADAYQNRVRAWEQGIADQVGNTEKRLTALGDVRTRVADLEDQIAKSMGYAAISGTYDRTALEKELADLLSPYGGRDGLEKQYGEAQRASQIAKMNADGVPLVQVGNWASEYYDKDFDKLTGADSSVMDNTYRWINDEQFRADVTKYGRMAASPAGLMAEQNRQIGNAWLEENGAPDLATLSAANYDRMTDEERALYNYHYAKGGAEQANTYLKLIAGDLNRRKAEEEFQKIKGKTGAELAAGIGIGLDQFARGASGLTDDLQAPSVAQYKGQMIREDLKDDGIPLWYNFKDNKWENQILGSSTGQIAYDAITTTANMAPSVLTSAALTMLGMPGAATWVGTGAMGVSAAGNARQEALGMGYSDAQATSYGLMVGVAEASMERLLGGISALGGQGLKRFAGGKFVNFLDNLDNALLRVSAEVGESMLSEGVEEYLQEIIDPMLRNVALGEDNDLSLYSPEALYSGLLGAITGGLMEGPTAIANDGRRFREAYTPEMESKLLEAALSEDEGSAPYALAQRYMEKWSGPLSGQQLAKLAKTYSRHTGENLMDGYRQDAEERLAALEIEDDAVVAAIAKTMAGDKLNRRERRALERSAEGRKVLQDMQESYTKRKPVIDTVRERTRKKDEVVPVEAAMAAEEGAENAHSNPVGEAGGIAEGAVAKNATAKPSGISGQLEQGVNESVDAVNETVDAVDTAVETVEESTPVEADSGAEVEPEAQSRTIEEVAAEFGEQAGAVRNFYQEGQDVESYARGFRAAYDMGRSGVQEGYAMHSESTRGLTEHQRKMAWLTGKGAAALEAQRAGAALPTGKAGTWRKGTLKGVNITTRDIAKAFNINQRSAYKTMAFYAEAAGVDVVVYRSTVDEATGKLVGPTIDGVDLSDANGAFVWKNDKIYIDINAGLVNGKQMGDVGRYTALRTFGHEFTHFVEKWNPEGYEQLRELAFDAMTRQGMDVDDLIARQMSQDSSLDYDRASREVVAEAMTDILRDSTFAQELAKKNQTLFQKLREKLKRFVERIRSYFDQINPNRDPGAKALQQELEGGLKYLDEIVELYDKVAMEAAERHQAALAQREAAEVSQEELTPGQEGVAYNESGEPVAASTKDGTVQLSLRTYEEDGREALREYLGKCVTSKRLTKVEMQEMLDGIEEIYTVCKEFKDKYAPFAAWSDAAVVRDTRGKPVFSVVTPNGDYKMNLDFSLVCKKRRTLDAVFSEMIRQGIIDDFELGQKSVVKINEIIRSHGLETACALCFVDAKRFRQAAVADSFVKLYNELLKSMAPEGTAFEYHNFGGYEGFTALEDAPHTWSRERLDFAHLDTVMREYGSKTVEHKVARYLKTHPEGRKLLMRGDFMSARGFDAVKVGNRAILGLYNSKKGTGGPKAAFGDVQYMNEILSRNAWTPGKAYEVGGVRIQSFSDYVPRMVFDYVQMIYDLAAKKLPAHGYTKEDLFVKQFGLTGAKINMSLIPAVAEGGIAPGLDAQGNYVWAGESFDFETAKQIQNAPGYTENCGTICVGVSYDHIVKLLGDPDIRVVIPYHKSGLNPIVAHMNKIAEFTDYTTLKTNPGGCQNTMDKDGNKVTKDFNFNEVLRQTGDPRAAAQQYLDWCDDKGYTARFAEFAWHENYYKLLTDFTVYDKDGAYVPQREVRAVFPKADAAFGPMKGLIEAGLQEDAVIEGRRDRELGRIVEEIKATIPRTEAEIEETEVRQAEGDVEARVQYSQRNENTAPEGGAGFSEREALISGAVDEAIANRGILGDRYNQKRISGVTAAVAGMVMKASGGEMDVSEKYIAIGGGEVWHEYRRHTDESTERDRGQIAFTKQQFVDAINSIYQPDIVECVFRNAANPTQRQSFAYAKQTPEGHYVVVEAVGGKKNPNIIPVEILYVSESKWDRWIGSGKTIGEMLFENDRKKLAALDAEFNKKNRVTAAQFASDEAIAITPHSPRFTDMIPHGASDVNGHPETEVSFQRREGTLSDWEVLDRAAEALGREKLSEAEQEALAAFKGRLQKVEALEAQRAEQGAIWHDHQFAEGGDREKARLARNKMKLLDDQLRKGYAELLSLEDKGTLRNVLKKARGEVEKQERQAAAEQVRQFRREQSRMHRADIRTMEREFLRLVREWEKSEKKAGKSDEKAAALREALDNEIAAHKADQGVWSKEFARLMREYEKSDRKADKLAQRLEANKKLSKDRVEGRKKTALRHRIEGTVKELERLLLKGDKKRHVKDGMRNFVEEALASATVLFADTYSDEALVLDGIGTELTPEENRLIEETQRLLGQKKDLLSAPAIAAESEAIAVGDTSGFNKRMKEIQKLDRQISVNMGKLHDVLVRERSRLNRATVGAVLANLSAAYRSLGQNDDLYIRGAALEEVWQHLDGLAETIGGATSRDLTLEQLEAVSKAFQMVLHTVRSANKLFAKGQREGLVETSRMAAMEVTSNGKNSKLGLKLVEALKKFGFNNLKPVYFFEHLGSKVMRGLYKGLLEGQSQWAKDVDEARDYYRQAADRAGFDKWDMEKTYSFRATSGERFKLNLQQMMSLYAYSRREQARDHIRKGGIVIDADTDIQEVVDVGGKLKVKLKGKSTDATAYNIDDVTLGEIISKLTGKQKLFVEQMQDYLSGTMGGKGNEVSMELYGVKLFNEQNYLPIRSAHQYMARAKEQAEQTARVKNAGFTKSTVPHASNPVVLTPFMDIWADHVNEMSLYHAMTLPLEDLHRVYTFSQTGDGGQGSRSVTAAIENAFGKQATGYIDQLMKDLNGGARVDSTTGFINKSMALFKKGSTFLSASVVIQQPSAILRATALVDGKYFRWATLPGKWALDLTARRKQHDRLWAECKQYAPIALIKEMGYFDTSVGRSTRDFIQAKEYKGWKEKAGAMIHDSGYRDEFFSRAPALADELAWSSIWEAVKREQHDKHPKLRVSSEEFLKLCGERFTEVIDKTQVYDSVLTRSANMRSKDTGMKMATAFMAEPTVSANMVADAMLKGKRGDKKFARRAIGSVLASGILNAMLYSLVAAARDDDEDKEYWERYLGSVTGEVFEVINPATYLPFGRDIVSLLQGYDVERSDMALVADLINAIRALGSDSKTGLEKVEGFTSTALKLLNLPLGNVWRDAKALYNVLKNDIDGQGSTAVGIGYAVRAELPEWIPGGGVVSNEDQLYEAILSGDKAHEERVRARFKDKDGNIDEGKGRSALRKAIRENDSRIREAAVYLNEGQLLEYYNIVEEITGEGFFHKDDVVSAIGSEASSLQEDGGDKETAARHKSAFKAEHFAIAAADGDSQMMNIIKADLILTAQDNGKTETEAEAAAVDSIRGAVKEAFVDGDTLSEAQVQKALTGWCDATKEEAEGIVEEWNFEKRNGYALSELEDVFVCGEITADEAEGFLVSGGGYARTEAERKVLQWQCEVDTGIRYDDVQQLYVGGKLTADKAKELRVKYGESSIEDARKTVLQWQCEKDNGIKYSDIDVAYLSGDITEETAIKWLVKYGEKDEEAAALATQAYRWRDQHAEYKDLSDDKIDRYIDFCEGAGISIPDFYEANKQVSEIKEAGGTQKENVVRYIRSLPLNKQQKWALWYAVKAKSWKDNVSF